MIANRYRRESLAIRGAPDECQIANLEERLSLCQSGILQFNRPINWILNVLGGIDGGGYEIFLLSLVMPLAP